VSAPTPALKRRAARVLNTLKAAHPDARLFLAFDSPLQLLIATILAAQCRDETINEITPVLFGLCPDARALAELPTGDLRKIIKSSGFFRQKAESVKGAARAIVDEFDGRVPARLEDLTSLPGVGRKTANIVLANAFGMPAIGVDTHVQRVPQRLGWTSRKDPDKIEADLCEIIPRRRWIEATHVLGTHGRRICLGRKPHCTACPVRRSCEYYAREKGKESPDFL
jgi:endonuclease-3